MPPKKTTTEETKQEQPETNMQEVIDGLEKRKGELEDYIAGILNDLHLARTFFQAAGKPAGERFNTYYVEGRDLLGDRGQAIDKKLRGV